MLREKNLDHCVLSLNFTHTHLEAIQRDRFKIFCQINVLSRNLIFHEHITSPPLQNQMVRDIYGPSLEMIWEKLWPICV